MERCCDAVEHGEGVPFVVGVFEAADDGGSGAHQLGKGALGKACLAAEVVDFAGDGVVGADLFKGGDALRLSSDEAAVQDGDGVGSRFLFGSSGIGV